MPESILKCAAVSEGCSELRVGTLSPAGGKCTHCGTRTAWNCPSCQNNSIQDTKAKIPSESRGLPKIITTSELWEKSTRTANLISPEGNDGIPVLLTSGCKGI